MKHQSHARTKKKQRSYRMKGRRGNTRSPNKYASAHQGQQEMDRRKRQIARGSLKAANGLVQ